MQEHDDNIYVFDALKRNDESMFCSLFRKYYPRLFTYSLRFVKDEEISRDILQDCFGRLWEKRHGLTPVSMSALLYSMVRNSCLNHLKHRLIVEKKTVASVYEISRRGGWESLYNLDMSDNADNKTLYQELLGIIKESLDKMPERTREIFLMSRFEGLKNREISERLGISSTAVEKHISKALKILSHNIRSKYSPELYMLAFLLFLS